MRHSLVVIVLAGFVSSVPLATVFAQGAVPPAGDIKELEPPIDQRKKQQLDTKPPTIVAPATDPKKLDAPDIKNKGTTDAR